MVTVNIALIILSKSKVLISYLSEQEGREWHTPGKEKSIQKEEDKRMTSSCGHNLQNQNEMLPVRKPDN